MRAAWFSRFGPASEVLEVGEQPQPIPSDDEVLVQLRTSGINPSDVKKRAGSFPDLLDNGLVIPHSDGAGIIKAVGRRVDEVRIGERVWIYQAQYGRRLGSAAQYVTLHHSRVAPLPDNTSFEVGACLGIPAMTAHRCVFADGPVAGQRVLITGGAGRVGHYAIQWASAAGAAVIATASSPEDRQACLEAGAAAVVSHRSVDWSKAVLDASDGRKMDRVIDVEFGANLAQVLMVIRTGGTIATYSSTQVTEPNLPFLKMMFMDLTIRMVIVYAMPEAAKEAAIQDINARLLGDGLKHRVARTVPLNDIARGHELIEQGGFRGCVILNIS